MQEGYFKTAWNDIKSTPGWIKKMLLLALIMFIPIFGPIVVFGYLYGWARDAAWGVQGPMPARIFGNEDGKLYSRGFFILVLGFVLGLVPGLIAGIYTIVAGLGAAGIGSGVSGGINAGAFLIFGLLGIVFFVLFMVAMLILFFFEWVGAMRISIYGRLSAGFQIKKIWAMIRKDTGGLLRILGMLLITTFVASIIISIISVIVFAIIFALAMALSGGSSYYYSDGSVFGLVLGVGFIGFLLIVVLCYAAFVVEMWIQALVVRSLGYWTRQFDVPSWRGQEDLMPFEVEQMAAKATSAATPIYQQAPSAPQSQYGQAQYAHSHEHQHDGYPPHTHSHEHQAHEQHTHEYHQYHQHDATAPVYQQPVQPSQEYPQAQAYEETVVVTATESPATPQVSVPEPPAQPGTGVPDQPVPPEPQQPNTTQL